jgi:hypothetical protein
MRLLYQLQEWFLGLFISKKRKEALRHETLAARYEALMEYEKAKKRDALLRVKKRYNK